MRVDYEAVYGAWLAFRKGKKPTSAIDEFAYSLEDNLFYLASEFANKSYEHGDYTRIVLQEKKRRDLAVASVCDRIVHRLLYDHLLHVFDAGFDFDVWSCRKNKGLHKCLARTEELPGRYNNSYVWRADIVKFFDSVDHGVLLDSLNRRIRQDNKAIWLNQEVISSYSVKPSRGIPIGNLTSQLYANIYLNEFDRFTRHVLKPQAYVRYGDDFIMFYSTRRHAFEARVTASDFFKKHLKLRINPKNNIVVPSCFGLKFLGHEISDKLSVVDKSTTKAIIRKVNWDNASRYRSLFLQEEAKDCLDWTLLAKYFDVDSIM